jgi:hypothetical protein
MAARRQSGLCRFYYPQQYGNNRGQIFQRVAESGEAASIDGDIINTGRKKVPVRFTVSLLHTKRGGRSKGLLVVLEDITVLQKKEQSSLFGGALLIISAIARRCRRYLLLCR